MYHIKINNRGLNFKNVRKTYILAVDTWLMLRGLMLHRIISSESKVSLRIHVVVCMCEDAWNA